jgi:RsiW-degrading membrane proteinase PrsW (M82 family)
MERLALFCAAVVPAFLILSYGIVKFRDSWISEPLWTAFFLGGVGAIGAIPIELVLQKLVGLAVFDPLPKAAMEALFVAAIPEEAIKFFLLVGAAERHVDVRRRIDVFTLALAVSVGFAMVENFFYVVEPGDWRFVAAIRAISSVPGHGIDGLVMGALVAAARLSGTALRPMLALALAVPVVLHAAYDFPLLAIKSIANGNLELLGLIGLAWLGVLVLSVIFALWLNNRILVRAIDADRRSGHVVSELPVRKLLVMGVVFLIGSPFVGVLAFVMKDIPYAWVGVSLGIMPMALGIDLIWAGWIRSRQPAP